MSTFVRHIAKFRLKFAVTFYEDVPFAYGETRDTEIGLRLRKVCRERVGQPCWRLGAIVSVRQVEKRNESSSHYEPFWSQTSVNVWASLKWTGTKFSRMENERWFNHRAAIFVKFQL